MKKQIKYELIASETASSKSNEFFEDIFVKIFLGCFLTCIVVFYNIVDLNLHASFEPFKHQKSNKTTKIIDLTNFNFENKTQRYFVHTNSCYIPYVDPFTPGVQKIYKPPKAVKCSNDEPLIDPVYDINARQYLLHINTTVEHKFVKHGESVKCCYREVVRAGSGANVDKNFKLLQCIDFQQEYRLPKHIDSIIVECKSNLTKKILQKDAFSFVQHRSLNKSAQPNLSTRKTNVLFIGVDTLSRINFRRTMPKTLAYMTENHWFELEGYNKVGDNTYPNLMPLLTGIGQKSSYGNCNAYVVNGLDNCGFIWENFKNAGYHTAYAEDEPRLSTFNYMKKGFTKPPTDYYLRPFLLAIEKTLKVKNQFYLPFCVGRRQYGEYVYDYALDFAKRCSDEPNFGFFWTNSFSHNSYTGPATMDAKVLQYLSDFEHNGILETSIVIFLSDHGCRWGPLLKQPEGFLEERLPTFFIWLPSWFRNKYPEFAQALDINRHRLTSPFDIYMTMKHILALDAPEDPVLLAPPQDCPKCQSIFHEVSINRTCYDAGIPEHWCTCKQYHKLIRDQKIVKNVTNLVINEMNRYLAGRNLSNLCRKITLKSIDSAEKETDNESEHKESYRMKFTIAEKQAKFQATVLYQASNDSILFNMESDMSRLNSYANDSKCINDKKAQKYCICKK